MIDILKDYYFIQGMTFMVIISFSVMGLLSLLYKPHRSDAEETAIIVLTLLILVCSLLFGPKYVSYLLTPDYHVLQEIKRLDIIISPHPEEPTKRGEIAV